MRRIATTLIALFALLGPGCGESETKLDFPERELRLPDLARAGSVAGTVRFLGEAPPRRRLATACTGHDQVLDESLVVTDGKIRDVLVYVAEGAEDFVFPWERTEARIDQEACAFVPHVLAVRARQPIRVHNSDPISHNIHVSPRKQKGFIHTFAGQGDVLRQLVAPELSIRTTCDLHANMLMHIHVLDHPWFLVTGEDGRFLIPDLPPGTYRLAARHEELGEQSRPLVIPEDGEIQDFDFEFTR